MSERDAYLAYVDGACRGNPGPMGIGGVIYAPDGAVICEISEFKGHGTNNKAEYLALIELLESAHRYGIEKLMIRSDSELLVRQLAGVYKVKHDGIKPLYERALALLGLFQWYDVVHVRREQNREADRLANQALNGVLAG